MSTDPYDSLLDEMERTAPRQPRAPKVAAPKPAGNRYGAYDAQTEGDWTITRAPAVKDWYKQTYGRDLPVTAEGQSGTHNRMGLNHSDSLDVGLNPTTPEGQALVSYLKQNGIPYLAYDRAVPGGATGPHVHVGYPSKRGTAQPADPYAALLDELESSPATSVSETALPQSPDTGAATPAASQANQAPAGARPPQPTGYLDETQERPEDFATLKPPAPSLYTSEGRAARDAKIAAEAQGGALYRIPVGRGATPEAVKAGVAQLAKDTQLPPEFVEGWLKRHSPGLYEQGTGKSLESSPTGYAAIPTEMVGQMRKDYRASLSLPARAVANVSEVLSTHTPGEVLAGVGGEAGAGALRGLDVATRPMQAGSAAFWAKVRGADNVDAVKTAWEEFRGENPEMAKNVIAEALRHSDRLNAVNPRLPDLAGFVAEMVVDPMNVIPGGLIAKGATRLGKVAKEGGRLAKFAEGMRDLGLAAPDIPAEAFRPLGDSRVLGDLTRRAVPEASVESLPDIPVGTLEAPRVVRNRAQAEPGVSEVVSVPERAAAAPQASNGPVTETIIRHSNPRIDGGRVVGQTADGRLRVENNEGGVSVVQHPRRHGNREATLVKREVQTGAEEVRGDTRPDEVGGQVGQGGEDLGRENLQQPAQAGAEARVGQEGQVADARAQAPDGAEVQRVEAAGRGAEAAPQPPPVSIARPADATATPTAGVPDRLSAPVPGPRAFRAQMKSKFRLSDEQADAVTELTEARARAWSKEQGRDPSDYYVERFAGVVRGGESAPGALNQVAGDAPTFYSQAQRVVSGVPMERMQPRQLQAMLDKGGVKAEELKWTGLDDYLREKAGRNEAVTKSEALEFLRQNEVRVEEVVKGERLTDAQKERYNALMEERKRTPEQDKELAELKRRFVASDSTKFSQYTLPGAKEGSYRELLLTLPEKVGPDKDFRDWQRRMREKYGDNISVDRLTPEEDAERLRLANSAVAAPERSYRSSHYDEPNILAHVRFNERVSADGARTLFVEEIQSDFGQSLRKEKQKLAQKVDADFEKIVENLRKNGKINVIC